MTDLLCHRSFFNCKANTLNVRIINNSVDSMSLVVHPTTDFDSPINGPDTNLNITYMCYFFFSVDVCLHFGVPGASRFMLESALRYERPF